MDYSFLTEHLLKIATRSQRLVSSFLERHKTLDEKLPPFDPGHVTEAFKMMAEKLITKPDFLLETNISFWQDYVKLLQNTMARASGQEVAEPVIAPEASDKRFKDPAWQEVWMFDYIKQSYLLMSRWAQNMLDHTDGLPPKIKHKIDFYTHQMIDATSPTNFWMTNPEVLRTTLESKGENLLKGLENMLNDMERGHGQLLISMSDNSVFKFGQNIASSKGKVVFQNELIQLIQYSPLTETVHKTPFLIVPPWINKFYILDLKPENSFIRYMVEQGHTVFCISWANPTEKHAKLGFEDYMTIGPVTAMREVKKITGENSINCLGYCIGGTLLSCALAWLATVKDRPKDIPQVNSVTYFASLVDFSQPGDLGVFIDEDQISMMESMMKEKGYLPGTSLAMTFSMLRANDLIWSFVINNYLLGHEPFPFDLLTWNSDSTNLPAAMHSYYLRNMYLENNLVKPNKLSMKGVPIDLRKIDLPIFFLASQEDHITLWRAIYKATQIYTGKNTFCLAGSGHIAGVINPPSKKKYGYWTNPKCPPNPDDWYKDAQKHEGSWWPEWIKWLDQYAGDMVPARDPAKNPNATEDAPGSYVVSKAG